MPRIAEAAFFLALRGADALIPMREDRPMSPRQAGGRDPVRIVIADDDRLFAQLVRTKVSEQPELEVVGIAANGQEAVDLAQELEPDLVVMDVSMPLLDGIDATRMIRD